MVKLQTPNYFLLVYSRDLQQCNNCGVPLKSKLKNTAFWQLLSIPPALETSVLQSTVLENIWSLASLSRHSANHSLTWRYKQTDCIGGLQKYLNLSTVGDNRYSREQIYMGQRESCCSFICLKERLLQVSSSFCFPIFFVIITYHWEKIGIAHS